MFSVEPTIAGVYCIPVILFFLYFKENNRIKA